MAKRNQGKRAKIEKNYNPKGFDANVDSMTAKYQNKLKGEGKNKYKHH